jgi:hypothetical protein
MEEKFARFTTAVRRFADLLPAVPVSSCARGDLAAQSRLLVETVTMIANEPAQKAPDEEAGQMGESLDRTIELLEQELRKFRRELLAGEGGEFSEDAFGRRLEGADLEELNGLLAGLNDCEKKTELDELERQIEGLAGLKPPGRVARLKAIVMLAIELILRIKGIPGAEAIRRIVRQLLRQIDRMVGGAGADGGGTETIPDPNGGGILTEPEASGGNGRPCNYTGMFMALSVRGNHDLDNNLGILEIFDDRQSLLMRGAFRVPAQGGAGMWVPVGIPPRQVIQTSVQNACGQERIFALWAKITVETDTAGQTQQTSTPTAWMGNNKICSVQGFTDNQEVRGVINFNTPAGPRVIEAQVKFQLKGICGN